MFNKLFVPASPACRPFIYPAAMALLFAACGSGTPQPVVVAVSPETAALSSGASEQFAATVTGTSNTSVAWSIAEGASGGTVTASGLYTAPAGAGAYHVVATSSADSSKSAAATVTVTLPVQTITSVVVVPGSAALLAHATQQFTAQVNQVASTQVTWSVSAGGAGGTIDLHGLYTAPAGAGRDTVVATSAVDSSKSGSAAVTVTLPTPGITSVAVSPAAASVLASQTKQLSALVNGAASTDVAWSVSPGGAGGTVSSGGLYTAPASAGSDTVIATSKVDTTKSGSAQITVSLPPPPISVSLNPAAASLSTGASLTFVARVTNSSNQSVTWSVSPASGGGSISSAGNYTAPQLAGRYTVVATSVADPSKTASAAVVVSARALTISLTPSAVQVPVGTTQQFVATVANPTGGSNEVTWSVTPAGTGGTIDNNGLYTAPATSVSGVQVVATSVADTSKSATAGVTISSLLVSLNPAATGLQPGMKQQFIATVKGDSTNDVQWSVEEGARGGSISADGVYTAPAATGTYHVIATSSLDSTQSGVAAILVSSAPAVGVAGGSVTDPGTGITIALPSGAVDSETVVTASATAQPAPASLNALSPVYQFEPDGRVFTKPITVSLPLPPGVVSAAIYWSRADGSGFESIGGAVANGQITAQVTHFSQGVVGPPAQTRTVNGVGQITWVSATSRVSEAIDYSSLQVEALVRDGAGNTISFPGTGTAQGTFSIPNVPVGIYRLHLGQYYLDTDSNTPDLGHLNGGKPLQLRTPVDGSDILDLTVTGLDPWANGDELEFACTQEDDWDFNTDTNFVGTIAPGTTSVEVPVDLSAINATGREGPGVIQGSHGDVAMLAQLSSLVSATSIPYRALTHLGLITTVDMPADGTTSFALQMQPVAAGSSVSFDFPATKWNKILQDGNPLQTPRNSGVVLVEAQPGLPNDGFYSSNLDLLIFGGGTNTPVDLVTGQMSYAPLSVLPGNWSALVDVRAISLSQPLLPGTADFSEQANFFAFTTLIDWVTTLGNAASGTILPPLSMPTQLAVGGHAFFGGATGVGTAPTITWSAPAVGTPVFYKIDVYSLDGSTGETVSAWVASFTTVGTSVVLPDGFLATGTNYAFAISAYASTSGPAATALATSPYRNGIDVVFTHTVSGIFSP